MADLTAQQIIKSALRKIGAIATGETPTNDELSEALEAMKVMLRAWSSEGLYAFVLNGDNHTLTAGTTYYEIGTGATINTPRPVQIVQAFIRANGIDTPVDIIGPQEYLDISQKEVGATQPSKLWYNPGYSVGVIYVWPPGGGQLTVMSYKPLTEPASLTEDITFPGVYDMALIWGLACEMAPEYGKEPSAYMLARAVDAKSHIVGINAALSVDTIRPEILRVAGSYNIDHG